MGIPIKPRVPSAGPNPPPPVIAPTGNSGVDALAGVVNRTAQAFQEGPPPEQGTLGQISHGVNAAMAVVGAPFELLDTGMAAITSSVAGLVPGMPAATLLAPHLAPPHAHSHPPSLIPPAPPVPLPSIGTTVGAGCVSVLVGSVPAARASDVGLAPTCGSLAPAFEVWTGSSNTFIGGSRAARMTMDLTRHCNPASALGAIGKAMGAVAVGAQALGAGAQAAGGQGAAAAMMAAQAAADAAALALSALLGKDPGIPPGMGVLMLGNPTVLIGGLPLPDTLEILAGAAGLLKSLKKMRQARRARLKSQNVDCDRPGEPIDPVSGASANEFVDYECPRKTGFKWERYYNSDWSEADGALGYGFRHSYQREIRLLRSRALYVDGRGREYEFARGADGRYGGTLAGYRLIQRDARRFLLQHETEGAMGFVRAGPEDSAARLVGLRRDNVESNFQYDEDGKLVAISHRARKTPGCPPVDIRFHYDAQGHLVEVLRVRGDRSEEPLSSYAYDTDGCLTSWQDALGANCRYVYDPARRMTKVTDRNGYAFHYRYDADGRCIASTGDDGLWRVRLKYQPGRTLVTEADGGIWTFLYDEAGTVTRVIDPYRGVKERITHEDGQVTQEIDSGGRVMRWLYDERGRHTGRVDRWGNIWPTKDQAPNLPNPLAHKVPRTPFGLQWGAALRVLPSVGRLPLPRGLEELGEHMPPQSTPAADGPRRKRDCLGRVLEQRDPQGRRERFHYDPEGRLLAYRDKDDREFRYERVSWNLRGAETDPLGNSTRFAYTKREKIARIVDANGNESAYDYDYKDRITKVTRDGVLREAYKYDTGDRLIEKRDGDGKLLLKLKVGESGLHSERALATGEVHSYAYDERGNFTKASSDKHDIALAHGSYGRRTLDSRDGRGVTHSYAGAQLAGTAYFERFVVTYRVLPDGGLSIETPVGGSHRFQRSDDGRILKQLGNGTSEISHYDADGRCTGRVVWRDDPAERAWRRHYQYSATGELRQTSDSRHGTTSYDYDAAHRLICERPDSGFERRMAYDPAGNLLSLPSQPLLAYGAGNRLAGSPDKTFHYDRRNHLAAEVTQTGLRTRYHYNSLDMLVRVSWSDRSEDWTAEYDGLGRRIHKTLGDQRTDFYWDGDRLAAELAPDGGLRLYLYANEAAFLPFMFIDYDSLDAEPDAGQAYYPLHDQVGLPLQIEDDQGKTVWRAEHVDPYGAIEVAPGNRIAYDLRFPGHYYDRETGLHYNRFRYYSPTLGRYLQSDPAGQSGGINLYAYPTNPLVDVDVLGLSHPRSNGNSADGDGNSEFGPNMENPSSRGGLEAMSDTELQDFCKTRVDELAADMTDRQQSHVTLGVTVAQRRGDPSTRRVIVTSSADDGSLPPGVGPLRDNEEVGRSGPEIRRRVARDDDGNTIREPVLDSDGNPVIDPDTNEPVTKPVMQNYEVDPDTGEAQPYPKANQTEPDGESRHHAEQRAQDSLDPDEEVAAMAPSRPCCAGCQDALGDNLDRVHPDRQGDI